MKLFGKFCYALGIVIAIGVGMLSSIREVPNHANGSALHNCDHNEFVSSDCQSVSRALCTKAYRRWSTLPDNPKPWNYFRSTESQCVDAACKEKAFNITSDCNPINE
jgi:hypothetical protein